MTRISSLFTALLILFLMVGFASAATYYVATTGDDDTGDGSVGNPWATLQKAVDTISAGDTILVQPGTYAGCRIRSSGSSGSPKTLQANGAVLLNTPGALCRRPSTIEIISDDWGGTSTAYWVIDGFEVTGGKWGIDGIRCDHVTVSNNDVHDNGLATGTTGIHLAYGDYMLVENNESYDNGEHGIYTNNGADYGIIRNNTLYGNVALGVHMNGDAAMEGSDGVMTGWLLEKNRSYNNGANGFDGDGVEETTWKNNLVYGNGSKGIQLTAVDGLVNPTNLNIYNNTIVVPVGGYYCINFAEAANLDDGYNNKIKNNILYNADINNSMRGSIQNISTWFSGFESDYNVVVNRFAIDDNASKYTLAEWQSAYSQDLNSTLELDATEIFVNYSGGDYHLAANSPAIDAGTTVAAVTDDIDGDARPQGSAYDCGCYEASGEIQDLVITTTSLPNGYQSVAYSQTLFASGGVTPYSWSVISGSLPAGLSLTASTGVISGTPTTLQTANFTVQCTDSQGTPDTDTQALSITIEAEPIDPLVITTTSLPDGKRNNAYSQTLAATGGVTPYSWSVISGSLPAGLSLTSSTGVISGTPTTRQTANFTVQVTDDQGTPDTDTQALSIRIK